MIYKILVSDRHKPLLEKYVWRVQHTQGLSYVFRDVWSGGNRTRIYLHRQLTKAQKGQIVDHINGNGLDNRMDNLRICTHSQNSYNKKTPSTNKTGFKGVCKRGDKWRATIRKDGRYIELGLFQTPVEAHKAYCYELNEIDRLARTL